MFSAVLSPSRLLGPASVAASHNSSGRAVSAGATFSTLEPTHFIPVDGALHLVQLQSHNAQELFAVSDANRDHLRRWLPWLDETRDVAATRDFIDYTRARAAAGIALHCAVVEHGRIVGVCGFCRIERAHQRANIGYWLAREARGRGIITRAVSALAQYSFDHMDLNRVVIACATENAESAAVAERCGFTFEGVARQAERLYDRYVDHRIYSRLRDDA